MTREEAKAMVNAHNEMIDNYINNVLPVELGLKNNKITIEQWFKGQELIRKQGFWDKSMTLLKELRNNGFDVKIDMQTDKLSY